MIDTYNPTLSNFVAASSSMKNLLEIVQTVSLSCANVLVTGESGVGKEEVAKLIHTYSPRRSNNFVPINCTAIPSELLESELFGHIKGSFTGAVKDKKGLFEIANNGTLFLDEIGDLDFHLQAKLLRSLQNKEIRPIGSDKTIVVNIRIITATHRDLGIYVKNGKFREDLFYRLNVVPIHVPPLREHPIDIPELVNHFLKKLAAEHRIDKYEISDSAMDMLMHHSWPGNVRELQNVIERVTIFSNDNAINSQNILNAITPTDRNLRAELEIDTEPLSLSTLEERYIKNILEEVKYNKVKASQILGISRRTLSRKIEQYQHRSKVIVCGAAALNMQSK
ncbi:MAG: sigma-54 interaction domain-containing protein [Bdellovibrionales bacterium]